MLRTKSIESHQFNWWYKITKSFRSKQYFQEKGKEMHLLTTLAGYLWSCQFSPASKLDCTWKIEHKSKTQKYGKLSVGYFQQHNQAAPLSYIPTQKKKFQQT